VFPVHPPSIPHGGMVAVASLAVVLQHHMLGEYTSSSRKFECSYNVSSHLTQEMQLTGPYRTDYNVINSEQDVAFLSYFSLIFYIGRSVLFLEVLFYKCSMTLYYTSAAYSKN
jgi:hypothetical protein